MFLIEVVAVITLASAVGIISAMIGVGGGFLVVPALVLLFFIPSHKAVGTSLTMIIFTALSSTLAYSRQRRIDYSLGLILTMGTVPGAIMGAYVTRFVTARGLSFLFGLFLVAVALRMMLAPERGAQKASESKQRGWHRRLTDSKDVVFEYNANMKPGLALSFLGGFTSGFFGVGGGAVMVPVMNLGMGVPIHIAVATSMFMMMFTSLSGVATHLMLGNVLPDYALYLSIGVIGGAQVGALIARRLKARYLERIFGVFLVVVGLRMVLEYLS
ncbi:MAG: hypothetical protein AOA65_2407 [Candidatus Bathyarchaeota archaeon BA1]|nr:MAG: hypothetical protein AOA65_2407 [Candidatus Bathyarchaeota archaeon BA1]